VRIAIQIMSRLQARIPEAGNGPLVCTRSPRTPTALGFRIQPHRYRKVDISIQNDHIMHEKVPQKYLN
jgi:hypothetical protein